MTACRIAVDVGAGTADILIRREGEPPENSVKLVVPSQTQVVGARVRAATSTGAAVLFAGPTMGGGADTRAMKDHTAAGLPFLATASAALTFADDLDRVRARGVEVVADDEATRLAEAGALSTGGGRRELVVVPSGDLDAAALRDALAMLGAPTEFDGAAVAVQDHGFRPDGSNRVLRFSLWERAVRERRRLDELFYPASAEEEVRQAQVLESAGMDEGRVDDAAAASAGRRSYGTTPLVSVDVTAVPPPFTRMRAAVGCLAGLASGPRLPLLVGDTGPAALLGALADRATATACDVDGATVLVNVGNTHTIAAVAVEGRLAGVYEHHTGRLDTARLATHLRRFLAGELGNDEVRDDAGHGAVLAEPVSADRPLLVTGPNRRLLEGSDLDVRYPAPWGDMMIAGAVGLLEAWPQTAA